MLDITKSTASGFQRFSTCRSLLSSDFTFRLKQSRLVSVECPSLRTDLQNNHTYRFETVIYLFQSLSRFVKKVEIINSTSNENVFELIKHMSSRSPFRATKIKHLSHSPQLFGLSSSSSGEPGSIPAASSREDLE